MIQAEWHFSPATAAAGFQPCPEGGHRSSEGLSGLLGPCGERQAPVGEAGGDRNNVVKCDWVASASSALLLNI